MGALLLYFVGGSIVAVPFLAYHLLRTRRELNELRAELRRRGLIGPALDDAQVLVGPAAGERLAGGAAAPQPTTLAEPQRVSSVQTARADQLAGGTPSDEGRN